MQWIVIGGAVCAAVSLAMGWSPWRRNDLAAVFAGGHWSTAIWLSVGVAAAHWLMVGRIEDASALPLNTWPTAPLRNYSFYHWPFFIALGLLPLGLLEGAGRQIGAVRTGLVWVCRPLVIGIALYFALITVLDPVPDPFHPAPPISVLEQLGFLTLWALPIFALVALIDPLAHRRPGATLPLGLWFIAAASSGCFVLLGQLNLAMSAAGLAVALGALVVLSWLQPLFSLARGGVTQALTVLACQWAAAIYLAPIRGQWLCLGLMAFGVAALWLREAPFLAKRPPWMAAVLTLILVAVPIGASLGLASWQYLQNRPAAADPNTQLYSSLTP
ncbi:MAG TPA: hypothetical protein VL860_00325 [Planctomycetota bacterium]|nr:hypothetical protein [Planctomycetota bacterium]